MEIKNITDIHAHYDEKVFDSNRKELLTSMNLEGIPFIINSGSDIPSSYRSIDLANTYPFVYASVGIFPLSAYDVPDNWLEEIESLCKKDKVVAIGEIGLDYRLPDTDSIKQKAVFHPQLELAKKLNLPVVIHDCLADQDVIDALDKTPVKAVIHRFFSKPVYAYEFIKRGVYLSIGPAITYDDAGELIEVVKNMPLDLLVLETDAPFIPTKSHEGMPATSFMIEEVVKVIAEVRKDVSAQQVANIALDNAKKLFGVNL